MPGHIDCRLRLFKNNIAKQWFISAINGFHFQEENFGTNGFEAFDPDFNGAADISLNQLLRGRFTVDSSHETRIPQSFSPDVGEHHVSRPCIDERRTINECRSIERIRYRYVDVDSSHYFPLTSSENIVVPGFPVGLRWVRR